MPTTENGESESGLRFERESIHRYCQYCQRSNSNPLDQFVCASIGDISGLDYSEHEWNPEAISASSAAYSSAESESGCITGNAAGEEHKSDANNKFETADGSEWSASEEGSVPLLRVNIDPRQEGALETQQECCRPPADAEKSTGTSTQSSFPTQFETGHFHYESGQDNNDSTATDCCR